MKSLLSKSLIVIIAILIVFVLSLFAYLQTRNFKNFLTSTINTAVNSSIDQEFRIGSIEGNIVGGIKFKDIDFIIDGETFIKIDELSTRYSLPLLLTVLLRGDIPLHNTKLIGAEINLTRTKDGVWNFDRIKNGDKKKRKRDGDKKFPNLYLSRSMINDLSLIIDDNFRDDYLEFTVYESRFSIDLIGLFKKFNLIADDINADFNKLGGLRARNLKGDALITKDNVVFKNLYSYINGLDIQGQGVVNDFSSPDFKFSLFLNEYRPKNIGTLNAYFKADGKMYETDNIVAEAELSFIDSDIRGKRFWTSLEKIKMNGTRVFAKGDLNTEFGRADIDGYLDLRQILAKTGRNEYEFNINLNDLLIRDLFEVIGSKPDILTFDDDLNSESLLTARGSWTEGRDFTTDVNISDLKLRLGETRFLDAKGIVTVFLDHVSFDLNTETNDFLVSTIISVVDDSVLLNSSFLITGDVPYEDAGDNFDLSIKGDFDDSKIYGFSISKGTVDSSYENKLLRLNALKISSTYLDLTASGTGNGSNGLNIGFKADSNDIRFLTSLYRPLEVSGSVKASGNLKGDFSAPVLNVEGDLKNFRYRSDLRFESGRAKVSTELGDTKKFDIDSSFENLEYKNISLNTMDLNTLTDQNNIKVDMSGTFTTNSSFESNFIVYDYLNQDKTVEFSTLKLLFDDTSVYNDEDIKLALGRDKITFDSFRLKSNNSFISASGYINYNSGPSSFELDIKNLDSELFSDMLQNPKEFSGYSDLDLKLNGSLRKPVLNLNISSNDLVVNEFKSDNLILTVSSADGKTAVNFKSRYAGDPYSTITGEIYSYPNLKEPGKIADAELDLDISLNNIEIAPLSFLNENINELYGLITTDLKLTGSLKKPHLHGSATLLNAGIVPLPLQNALEIERADFSFRNNYANLKSTEVTSRSGSGQVSGDADLNDFDYRFSGTLNDLFVKHPSFNTKLTGDLNLDGKKYKMDINGKLKLNNLKVNVKSKYEKKEVKDIKFVDVRSTDNIITIRGDNIERDFFTENVALNLELAIPSNTWLTGMGARVDIKGDLTINKRFGEDQVISGTINTERGNYSAFGRNFKIEKGFISFPAITEFDPQIDLTASYEIQDINIYINLIGTAENPKINLTSSPPLDKSDIVSYLVFGTSNANLGSSQRNVSQELASNLAMGELADIIAPTFGIDVLSVQGSEEGGYADPQVKVGSYVDDNLYIGYERTPSNLAGATTDPQDKVRVEYKINQKYSIESIIGGDNPGADVFYNFDF